MNPVAMGLLASPLLSDSGGARTFGPIFKTGFGRGRNHNLPFVPSSIEALATTLNSPENDGRLVAFCGSFGAEIFPDGKGGGERRYWLWDRSGHAIRVSNVFRHIRAGEAPTGDAPAADNTHDFRDAAASYLLTYGRFVTVEGRYSAAANTGNPKTAPLVDVSLIDGRPLGEFLYQEP